MKYLIVIIALMYVACSESNPVSTATSNTQTIELSTKDCPLNHEKDIPKRYNCEGIFDTNVEYISCVGVYEWYGNVTTLTADIRYVPETGKLTILGESNPLRFECIYTD